MIEIKRTGPGSITIRRVRHEEWDDPFVRLGQAVAALHAICTVIDVNGASMASANVVRDIASNSLEHVQ
jgi:hypothetical protein